MSRRRAGRRKRTCIVCVEIGVENVCGLTVGSDDEGWKMVWNGRMVWRGVDCVDGGHDNGRRAQAKSM